MPVPVPKEHAYTEHIAHTEKEYKERGKLTEKIHNFFRLLLATGFGWKKKCAVIFRYSTRKLYKQKQQQQVALTPPSFHFISFLFFTFCLPILAHKLPLNCNHFLKFIVLISLTMYDLWRCTMSNQAYVSILTIRNGIVQGSHRNLSHSMIIIFFVVIKKRPIPARSVFPFTFQCDLILNRINFEI